MDAYPSATETIVINKAEKMMQETMARYDPSHDAYHVQRVRKTALALANSCPEKTPDLLVIELAALFHDVLDKKYLPKDTKFGPDGEPDSYSYFLPFFEEIKEHVDLVSTGRAKLVAEVVKNVSWTTEKRLRANGGWSQWHETCVELHCVQDADRLDAIGAFGIMRCSAYSAIVNRLACLLSEEKELSIFRPLHIPSEEPLANETAVGHFYDKLLHIKDRLKTGLGKKIGETRHTLMVDFLNAINAESIVAARYYRAKDFVKNESNKISQQNV